MSHIRDPKYNITYIPTIEHHPTSPSILKTTTKKPRWLCVDLSAVCIRYSEPYTTEQKFFNTTHVSHLIGTEQWTYQMENIQKNGMPRTTNIPEPSVHGTYHIIHMEHARNLSFTSSSVLEVH